ncbi:Type I secretion target repeat protein [Sulfitobacter noctilucicola]|uniref:Ca2+-binding RTX toxin-like protein n=1 Tax=Sulfitobacter noctilucicola TaxID=1342301 RepID=A0A7W6M787_9RHOB|nr:Hint domain-containing protein [Sulfitobacter noctilucicola]KIN65225.1 Type I secretion target repeat protein [Sulfitobacter noctilucicola]MBB4173641.1 Ca2+-binding RTX toxin-like protein [Sulfitobacter noctilucicola]
MAIINGTSNNDTLQGTLEDDQITGSGGQDLISGEGANDLIDGGEGDDTLFGDAGVGTAPGLNASPITLNYADRATNTGANAQAGDEVIYRNVAQLEDGTQIDGRLVLVSTTNDQMAIDMTGGTGFEILLNTTSRSEFTGETATFRLEFFDPATGEPVALNSTGTFNDLDRNAPGNQESVTIDAGSFTAFGTAADTSLNVTTASGTITAAGTEQNSPVDQDAWFSAEFENREFIEFTLETRSSRSGFTLSGDLIEDGVVTPIEAGDDTITGGSGQDQIFGQGGNDSLEGEGGDDIIEGGEGDDTLLGGDGQDDLDGGAGADLLNGGAGDDTIRGGDGEDTIVSGTGMDWVRGGNDSDLFTFDGAGSHQILGGEDADGADIDRIDLTGIDRNTYRLIRGEPEEGRIEFLDTNGNVIGRTNYAEIEEVIICFTPGTMIATKRGEKPVQQLKVGDKVFTRDNGPQELRWIGRRNLKRQDLTRMPHYSPILIRAGALGNDNPVRDMMVSPNHRMLITSEIAEMMFGESEVLVAAKHLVSLDGVDTAAVSKVSYIHMMFDQHEVILADGTWAESFLPGTQAMAGIQKDQRQEILDLFPELIDTRGVKNFDAARRLLKAHEAHLLMLEKKH